MSNAALAPCPLAREAAVVDAQIRRVVVLAPMPSELAPIVKALTLEPGHDGLRSGRIGRAEVVAIRTGMGMARAEAAASRVIDAHQPDHVIVVGIAGGVGDTGVGALICPEAVVDGRTDTRYASTPLGERGGGVVSSSDEFVVDPTALGDLVAAGVRAVDMETGAVAAVCHARGVPWSAIRVISDRAADHPDAAVFGLANADGSPNPRAALAFMVRNPRRIPQLLRLGRDAQRAARAAAAELARQLRTLATD